MRCYRFMTYTRTRKQTFTDFFSNLKNLAQADQMEEMTQNDYLIYRIIFGINHKDSMDKLLSIPQDNFKISRKSTGWPNPWKLLKSPQTEWNATSHLTHHTRDKNGQPGPKTTSPKTPTMSQSRQSLTGLRRITNFSDVENRYTKLSTRRSHFHGLQFTSKRKQRQAYKQPYIPYLQLQENTR